MPRSEDDLDEWQICLDTEAERASGRIGGDSAPIGRAVRLDRLIDALVRADLDTAASLGTREFLADNETSLRDVPEIVGRIEQLWSSDTLSFSDATMAFWALKRLLERRAREVAARSDPASRGRILIVLAPGEKHSFGATIAYEYFRLNAWSGEMDVSGDAEVILSKVAQHAFDAVGISVAHDNVLYGLPWLIAEIRRVSANPATRILVGGQIFVAPLTQYDFLGADHIVTHASEAQMLLSRTAPPDTRL